MKRLALLSVAVLVLSACSGRESEIDRFSACPGIESNFDFGAAPDVEGAEIVQIARPGKFVIEQLTDVLATEGYSPSSIVHLLRTRDTCGQHDLIAFVEGSGLCTIVLGRDFHGSACLEGDALAVPAVFNVPTGDPAFGQALAIHLPLNTRHVIASSGGRTIAAFPVNGWALIVTADGVDELALHGLDGSTTPVEFDG